MLLLIVLSSVSMLLLLPSTDGACAKDFLSCDNGQCVRREDWCDGKETCGDGSDEAYCSGLNWWGKNLNKCNKTIHFLCDDGPCWPLVARCDGSADCRDDSDEENCNSAEKSNEKIEESEESEEPLKVTKEKDEEDESKESSEEEYIKTKENSKEIGSGDITTTIINPTTTTSPDDLANSDEYDYDAVEVPIKTTTAKHIQPPTTTSPDDFADYDEYDYDAVKVTLKTPTAKPEVISQVPFTLPTTEMDFYAKKMGQKEVRPLYLTPTKEYRPPTVRPAAHYSTSRKPPVPYTGPTRPYTPRPYRYISGQAPSLYRGQYNQPSYPSYHFPGNNHVSQPRINHQQPYRNWYDGNGGRNGLSKVYESQLKAPSRFYFKKNYNGIYGRANYPAVVRGVEWIMSTRNVSGGWSKETPRALIALSLVNNSFLSGSFENDLMQKYFQVHLGINLLKYDVVNLNRLAMFANALLATCQDPRNFQGWDLTELIRNTMLKLYRSSRPVVVNPVVYLSLCLADRNLTEYEVHHLMTYLVATGNDEATRDMMCLALEAFACHMQKEKHNGAQFYSLQKLVWNATSKILQRMKEDGSFGSIYSTSLAAQALMSVNETAEWNPEATFRFLKNHQQRNGSFGNFLATYYALPALSGRSLLHLRNTECNPPRVNRELSPQEILQHPGLKYYVRYSLHMGVPLSTAYTIQVLVPTGISFFDVMRVAAYENDHFKFSYEEDNGKISVYSVSDNPNDPEEGLAWRLYIRSLSDTSNMPNIQQLYTGDIRELLPTPDQHFIFWYQPLSF